MSPRAAWLLGTLALAAPAMAANVEGRWLTQDRKGIVEIAPCGGKLCGKVKRVLDPKAPATDINNPEPQLRGRPMIGLDVLSGFAPFGKTWKGMIYDPKGGKTYRSIIRLNADGTLNVKGCILFFCQAQTWTRLR